MQSRQAIDVESEKQIQVSLGVYVFISVEAFSVIHSKKPTLYMIVC